MPSDPTDQPRETGETREGAEPALTEAERRALLPKVAQQALAEADARREKEAKAADNRTPEKGGPKGAEPTRFGDWERNGRAVDF
ncbi:MAG: DUF1674 domain-containing protein [Pseudomonadota bacterium]